MDRSLLLLILLEPISGLQFPLREYHYVTGARSWDDARGYCREHYHDIAIFDGDGDSQRASRPADVGYAWIGLLDDPAHWRPTMGNSSNSWVWSATGKPSQSGYQRFDTPQDPDNRRAKEQCVKMAAGGRWADVICSNKVPSVCVTKDGAGVSYTYVSASLSWSAALAHCRTHHTDLAMIEDHDTNTRVFNAKPSHGSVWIGLSRTPWHWADGSPLTFNRWQGGRPDNMGAQFCVAEDDSHEWRAAKCHHTNPFVCHRVNTLTNTVRGMFRSSADLRDRDVQTQLLLQLKAALRAHGYSPSKLSFSIGPQTLKSSSLRSVQGPPGGLCL